MSDRLPANDENTIRLPFAEIAGVVAPEFGIAPPEPVARLTRTVVPVCRSRRYTRRCVWAGDTRSVASESHAT
jgi:hypothetical protein